MKDQLIYRPDNKTFEIDGKIYRPIKEKCKKIDGHEHIDCIIYEEVDENEHQKTIDFIKSKLKEQINTDRVIEEILKNMAEPKIKRIKKLLEEKKTKIYRQNGCYGIYLDGGKRKKEYIEIFE